MAGLKSQPEKGITMADAREVLAIMKDVAKSRIQMLREGATFHDAAKREYYLHEYEKKVQDIDQIMRRLNVRLVYSAGNAPPGGAPRD